MDKLLLDHFNSLLWIRRGYSLFYDFILEIALRYVQLLPRLTWAFVELMVGVDAESHMEAARMPMWAVNDIGGTGTINVKHWEQNMLTGRFSTLER